MATVTFETRDPETQAALTEPVTLEWPDNEPGDTLRRIHANALETPGLEIVLWDGAYHLDYVWDGVEYDFAPGEITSVSFNCRLKPATPACWSASASKSACAGKLIPPFLASTTRR